MKNQVSLILISVITVGQVYAQKVGLNTTNPEAPLHIVPPADYTMYTNQPVLYAEYTGMVIDDMIAIKGKCKPADFFGIGGNFEGGYIGASGHVTGLQDNTYIGLQGHSSGTGTGVFIGVSGYAISSGTSYGVYGTASAGEACYAGYFEEGDVYIKRNLGIGRLSPTMDLDVLDDQAVTRLSSSNSTNGSVLELRNSTVSPTNLGAINFGTESATPGQIAYLGNDNLTIRVNSVERLRINPSGLVGLGRTPTTNRLEVEGNASKSSAGDWLANSDERLKKNIEPLDEKEMIEKLLSLKGVTYEWDDDKTGTTRREGVQYGFTAQNIQEVFPTLVEEDAKGYLQTAYGTYDAMTVEAIRFLYKENQSLKNELEEIRSLLKSVLETK